MCNDFTTGALDAISANICILNEKGEILYINKAWGEFYKSNTLEANQIKTFVGLNYLSICDAAKTTFSAEAQSMANGIRSVINGNLKEFILEYPCHSPNSFRWFLAKVAPFTNEQHQKIIIFHEDITSQKLAELALEESNKRFIDILYASQDAILLIGNNIFIDCNEATAKMLGYSTRHEFLMTHPSVLSPPFQPDGQSSFEKAEKMMQFAFEKGYNRFEWQHQRANGETFPVEVSLTPIVYNGNRLLHCVWRDITFKKLEENTLKLRNLSLASITQGVIITGVDRKINYVNKTTEKITGYSEKELLGASGSILHGKDTDKETIQKIRDAIKNDQPIQVEILNYRKDGEKFWNQLYISPVFSDDGKVVQYIGVQKDITIQKQTELELKLNESRWKFATEGAGDGVWDWDVPSSTVFYSSRWKEMIGYKEEEIGSGLDEWSKRVHPDDMPKALTDVQAHLEGKTTAYRNEHRVQCKDGSWKWILDRGLVISRDKKGNPLRVIGTHTDISQRKNSELELIKINANLEKASKIANELASKTQIATEAKNTFIANMSHEIRTPLNGIIGISQLLLETDLSEEQQNFVQLLYSSGQQLHSLTNDIIDFSKMEANQIELEHKEFNLEIILNEFTEKLKIITAKKQIQIFCNIHYSIPLNLKGDYFKLLQILNNLLGNAVKFTEKGSVKIQVTLAKENVDEVFLRFEVIDTGIGIPKDKQNLLFKVFSQVDSSTTRKYGGSGLGLAISKKLVKLMGGEIGVYSEEGKGSTFYFTVQFLKLQQELKISNIVENTSLNDLFRNKGYRILVVEDDPTNLLVTTSLLKRFGFLVDKAEDGEKALRLIDCNQYDLILMDIQMPIMDGIEATKNIRKRNYLVPIIALTASLTTRIREECFEAGMNDCLTKPISLNETITSFEKWLSITETSLTLNSKNLNDPAPWRDNDNKDRLQIFDKTGMMARLMGDEDLAIEVANAFITEISIDLTTLKLAIEKKDLFAIKSVAHKIKGSSSIVGGDHLRSLAFKIEVLAETQNIIDIKRNMVLFEEEIYQLTNKLSKAF